MSENENAAQDKVAKLTPPKEEGGNEDSEMILAVIVPADVYTDLIEFIHDTPAPRKVTNKLMKQLDGLFPQQIPIKKQQ